MIQDQSNENDSYELNSGIGFHHPDDFVYSASSFDDDGVRAGLLTEEQNASPKSVSFVTYLTTLLPFLRRTRTSKRYTSRSKRQRTCLRPSSLRRIALLSFVFVTTVVALEAIFFPSYTHPPTRYTDLRNRAQGSELPGRANPEQQRIYIAASIFDKGGDLVNGDWGESVLGLVDILGPENVHLSIYENDAGEEAERALQAFGKRVTCDHTITFEKHLSLDDVPHVRLPDGSDRVKRIVYLSEVRNRALRALEESRTRYDRMLYINDVVFDPVEAAQLLFATNADVNGKADYRAACAVDFINPFKYYDTFATRDYEGYGIGLPFFPWFTSVATGTSRTDVLAGSDAVRVRSCWGGMVAFDARFFQAQLSNFDVPPTAGGRSPSNMTVPYRFRAEDDLYWDASECCLIHADIQNPDPSRPEIYMNPYVRVAYDKGTLSWLGVTRRFEKLYSPVHYLISKAVRMPWYNPRRDERAWDRVEERVWVSDPELPEGGAFHKIKRTATHSGFCGRRALQVLKTDITSKGKNWEFLPVPE